ncbi:PREDICTED: uncharacterized protein LOC105567977 [Vollenhovia emeryi]|uniref:uncharacterized protein LOC105567977 n=1 Tax=Vollenhovia emeryi TaxID=411798 RepID=UPI0005F50F3A|nr:PREDICTED: uncharacterized protein LOC105567977 [Vollenhovia emeryi]
MDIYDTRYFRTNKLLLSVLGLWPTQSNKSTFFYSAIVATHIVLLPQIAFLFNCMKSVNDFYDTLPTLIGVTICIIKLIGLHWKADTFRELIEHVRYDWYLLAKHRDMWILIEYIETSRIFTRAYLLFAGSTAASMVTAPLTISLVDIILALNVTRTKQMPHPVEFFVDIDKHYYFLLAITFIGYAASCTTVIAIDTFYFAILQHACGLLAILSYRLKNIAVNDKPEHIDPNPVSKGDRDVKDMVQCIKLQIRIERLIHLIESAFAVCIFSDIGLGILLQCSSCVMIVTQMQILKNGPLLVLQCSRFLLSSWIGQRIIDHSSEIPVSAYNGLWYQTSLATKKMLLFLLIKCHESYRITMGKLYIICLESYTAFQRKYDFKEINSAIKIFDEISDRFKLLWFTQYNMSFFDNRYYYLNKRFLSVIGLWPFQSRLEANITFALAAVFIFSLTAFEFWGLAAGITDLSIIMENTSPLLVNSFIIMKFINCVFTNYKMKVLLEDIEETWKMKHDGPEKQILQHYAEESRTFAIRYAIALYATWLFYSTTPVVVSGIYTILPINETYTARFLYRLEHVLDMDKYFNLMMLHGFISVFYIVSVPIAIDSIFSVCTQHVCALFTCIRYNIERIQGSDLVLPEPDIKDDEVYRNIIACIKSYKHALKLSDVLSSNYAVSFLFLLGNIIICLSFGSAELIMVDNQLDEIIRILSANLAQLLHVFCLSLISQRLIDHSSGLQNAIYNCDWYKISLRSRGLLRFTLLRTTRPCQIKAGKIFVMSLENFSSILQVSLSYFTMLTSLQ